MAKQSLPVMSGAEYRRSIDGRVTLSSDCLDLKGVHITWHTQSEQVSESRRPATNDHQFVLYCSAEERGEYRYNEGAWRRYVKRRNDWFIAPAYENRIHWRWERMESPGMVCRVHIAPERLDRAASSLFPMKAGQAVLRHRMNVGDPMLTHLAFELKQELMRLVRHGRSDRYCRSLIDTFLFRIAGTYCEPGTDAPDCATVLSQQRRNRLQAYIEEHLGSTLSLDDMAEAVWMSKYHFARVFKHSFGEPPQAYVRRMRLERAMTLLRETDKGIAAVARTLGFATDSSFSRAFKKHVGLAPRDFQKLGATQRLLRERVEQAGAGGRPVRRTPETR